MCLAVVSGAIRNLSCDLDMCTLDLWNQYQTHAFTIWTRGRCSNVRLAYYGPH